MAKKILKEKVETKFKEVKKDEEQEPNNEEEAQDEEISKEESFDNEIFMDRSIDRTSPVLEFTNETQETRLEDELENVPSNMDEEEREEGSYVVNMPQYSSDYESSYFQNREEERTETPEMVRTFDRGWRENFETFEEQRRIDINAFQRQMQDTSKRREEIKDDYKIIRREKRRKEKLPFE